MEDQDQDQDQDQDRDQAEYLQQVHQEYPTCFFLQLIIESKRDEIINVFSQGSQQEKTKAANIMKEIDPSKATQYDAILQGPRG